MCLPLVKFTRNECIIAKALIEPGFVPICRHGDWNPQTSDRLRIGVAIAVYEE